MGRSRLFTVQEIKHCTGNARRIFRQVSRDASGESLEPLDEEIVFLGHDVEGTVVSVASLLLNEEKPEMWDDDEQSVNDAEDWDAEILMSSSCTTVAEWESCSANKLSFLFVRPRYQRRGYGNQMLEFVEGYTWARSNLPMKVESSRRGIGFFAQRGYIAVGEPIHCAHPSSLLFRTLQRMIKTKTRRLN